MQLCTKMCGIWKISELIKLLFFNNYILQCSSTIVEIPQGKIEGLRNDTEGYISYLGIPYATVTDRFQKPGPPPHWDDIFHAVKSVNCEQTDRSTLQPTGQKDCLVLNIFTPINLHKKLLPVLIVIPGGGFHFGLNNDDAHHPKYLMKKDIIVVSINYRLGAFGFLCLQTPEVTGNAGLKDQVAAIRWVKNNIQYFGGNPTTITLFGQSVGATSISYLLLSPETKGLFQQVILSSGSVLVPYALDNDPVGTASRIASRMGFTTNDPKQLLKIYQNASSGDILKASHFDDTNDPFAPYVFRPCIDKSKGSLVKENPRELMKSTLKKNVSIVVGYNNLEGIKWAERYNYDGLKDLNNTFSKIIPHNIIFRTEKEKSTFVAEVKDFYFNNQNPNSYEPLINYFSDSIIMYPMVAMTNHLLRTNVSVRNYYFKYSSNRNFSKRKTILAWMNGASHTDDLGYIFDPSSLRSTTVTTTDALIIDAMTSFWSNVAKTGNPSTKTITWQPSKGDDLKFLNIDMEITMSSLPNKERITFWNNIYKKYDSY